MRRLRAGLATTVLLLAGAGTAPAANAPDSPLLVLCRAYNAVRFQHPFLSDETDARWDGAAVEAIAQTQSNPGAVRTIVARMLATLNDPETRLSVPEKAGPEAIPRVTDENHTATIHVNGFPKNVLDTAWSGSIAAGLNLAPDTDAVTIDLRLSARGTADQRALLRDRWMDPAILGRLAGTAIVTPVVAERYFVGFPSEVEPRAPTYREGRETIAGGKPIEASPIAVKVPIAFVVDRDSVVPDVAFALRRAGKATIVSADGAPIPVPGDTRPFDAGNGVRITIRTSAPYDASPPDARATLSDRFSSDALPDEPHRVLALFRAWGAVEYFSPYLSLMHDDWDAAFVHGVTDVRRAGNPLAYDLAVLRMLAHLHDSHGFVSSVALYSALGAHPALRIEQIEGRPTIVNADPAVAKRDGFAVGDVIVAVDGENAVARQKRLMQYVNASTPQSALDFVDADGTPGLLAGPDGSIATFEVRKPDGRLRTVRTKRTQVWFSGWAGTKLPTVDVLPGNIGYADLSRLERRDVGRAIARLGHTRAIVFDMRGYPNETGDLVAGHFTRTPVAADRIRTRELRAPIRTGDGDVSRPLQSWYDYETLVEPEQPHLTQPIVVLTNVRAISQSEDLILHLQAADKRLRVVGEPTAGADGSITTFELPGHLYASFTGQAALRPNGVPVQRIGIVPDVRVAPTLRGLLAGKDEILAAGIAEAKRLAR